MGQSSQSLIWFLKVFLLVIAQLILCYLWIVYSHWYGTWFVFLHSWAELLNTQSQWGDLTLFSIPVFGFGWTDPGTNIICLDWLEAINGDIQSSPTLGSWKNTVRFGNLWIREFMPNIAQYSAQRWDSSGGSMSELFALICYFDFASNQLIILYGFEKIPDFWEILYVDTLNILVFGAPYFIA